ncbi:hypothetical protein ACN94_10305 [Gordonia paraffinivorans]|uniref:hypothetical protein n=1 Tax=Gordonia paraffinivorans TaxID=175628 RepID=UPI001C92F97D|nr:hypothetical protein [Gordonia paraffinivorans]MBY4573975.1 hypothetical protein [Gordonia paraffinivorans]
MSEHENRQPPEELETPSPDETPETDTTADTDTTTEESPNAEAAKYRTQRNEARAERDALAARVEALQRAAVEDLCKAASVTPRALWTVAELGDLVDPETGTVDRNAVTKAIEKARQELGITTVAKGAYVPNAGKMPTTPPATDRWAEAFSPKNRRR